MRAGRRPGRAPPVAKIEGTAAPTRHVRYCGRVSCAGSICFGFDIKEMVSEYRALRGSVIRLWVARAPQQPAPVGLVLGIAFPFVESTFRRARPRTKAALRPAGP